MNEVGCLLRIYREPARISACRHGAVAGPMIRLIACKNFMTTSIQSCKLDCIFNRRSAAQSEEGFVEITGTDLSEFFSKVSANLCYTAGRYVTHFLHLPYHGFCYPLVTMTNIYIH